MPLKDVDALVNPLMAVHGIYASFPRLNLADIELIVAAASLPLPSLSGAAELVDSGDELGQTGR